MWKDHAKFIESNKSTMDVTWKEKNIDSWLKNEAKIICKVHDEKNKTQENVRLLKIVSFEQY